MDTHDETHGTPQATHTTDHTRRTDTGGRGPTWGTLETFDVSGVVGVAHIVTDFQSLSLAAFTGM